MDAEILGGALAVKLRKKGGRPLLVHLTDGGGHYPPLGRQASARQAQREAAQAASELGVPAYSFGFDSRRVVSGGRYVAALQAQLMEWRPRVVITHWRGSWHPRHRLAYRLALAAIKASGLKPAVYYGENFEDMDGFEPTTYVDITDVYLKWWASLESYALYRRSKNIPREDVTTFPYYAYYHASPRIRGLEIERPMASAFARAAGHPRSISVVDQLEGDAY